MAAGEEFLRYFRDMPEGVKNFSDMYWDKFLDRMVVDKGKKLTVIFVGGYSVKM